MDMYTIRVLLPGGNYREIDSLSDNTAGHKLLYYWDFENLTREYGEGWYILRLLVIYAGNHIPLGHDNQGCYVRVYLPPPN